MDPVVKQKWVDALRSGDYKQGREGLRNNHDEFCCLGVLCDQWAGEWIENHTYGKTSLTDESIDGFWYDFRLEGYKVTMAGSFHTSWLEEFGLSGFEETELIMQNDDENASFDQIADWIEENL